MAQMLQKPVFALPGRQRMSVNTLLLGCDMGGCKTYGGRKTYQRTRSPENFWTPPKELLVYSVVDFRTGKQSTDTWEGWKTYRGGPKPLFGRGVIREVFHPLFRAALKGTNLRGQNANLRFSAGSSCFQRFHVKVCGFLKKNLRFPNFSPLQKISENLQKSVFGLCLYFLEAAKRTNYSEDTGLKVRFSLAMIVFETFELILCQMLSSQGKNAPSNPYPHYRSTEIITF